MRQATVSIDQQALQHNLNRVKQLAPQAKVVSMIKANAYGHGVENCIEALAGSDAFGVACLEEALEIRKLGDQHPITLVEGVFSADEMSVAIAHKIELVIHHQQQLDWLLAHADAYTAANLKVWVKLNSGMNRLGFKVPEIIDIINNLKTKGFCCVLTMHFANADADHPMNEQQKQQFLQVKTACAPVLGSCCNSAAILRWPDLHFDFVRPGIMLYGSTPFADKSAAQLDLQPVMQFDAAIIALNDIQAGEYVGYGSTLQAQHAMRIAVVSIGYGDGYPRAYLKQNYVYVQGKKVALAGRVSMDMIAIDVTGLDVTIGTTVELWGKQRSVDDVAEANGTIGYELLCGLSQRPVRQRI